MIKKTLTGKALNQQVAALETIVNLKLTLMEQGDTKRVAIVQRIHEELYALDMEPTKELTDQELADATAQLEDLMRQGETDMILNILTDEAIRGLALDFNEGR